MRTELRISLLLAFLVFLSSSNAFAHCQIPCGIYGDETRFTIMDEHVATIEKSINQINSLSGEKTPDHNQLVRWVRNKDEHANKLSEIATYYFLAQRVKPATESDKAAHRKYQADLADLHKIVVYSMKAKQSSDLENVKVLRSVIAKFKQSYLGAHKH